DRVGTGGLGPRRGRRRLAGSGCRRVRAGLCGRGDVGRRRLAYWCPEVEGYDGDPEEDGGDRGHGKDDANGVGGVFHHRYFVGGTSLPIGPRRKHLRKWSEAFGEEATT